MTQTTESTPTTPAAATAKAKLGDELPPEMLAAVEAEAGISVSDIPPELLAFAVEKSKKAGNDAFTSGNNREAARLYTQAIAGDPNDKALFSNRSAACLALGLYEVGPTGARHVSTSC